VVQGQESGGLATDGQAKNPLGTVRDLGEGLIDGCAGATPPIVRILFNPSGPEVVERVLRLAQGVKASARVQQRGLDGTGSDIYAKE
jgi:hypothetical protein